MKKIASRKDPRVIDLLIVHGIAGYGLYVMLVEYLGERKSFRTMDDIRRIAYELHADADTVRSILQDFNLFEIDSDGNIARVGERKPVAERKQPAEPVVNNVPEEEPLPEVEPEQPLNLRPMTRSERRRHMRLQQKSPDIRLRV